MWNNLLTIRPRRIWIFAAAGGILFAALDRMGYLLTHYGSIWVISENPWHRTLFHRILLRLPVSILAVFVLLLLTDCLMAPDKKQNTCLARLRGAVSRFFSLRHSFSLLWLIYFISFLPAFLGGYPGIFAADAPNQIGWTFSGWLTGHHPLLHTGILCGIFSATRSLGLSDSTAAAIYTLLQMLVLSVIFSGLSQFLKKEKAPLWLQTGTVLFLCLFPFHALMAVYTTKDTLFSGIFLLCLLQIYQMCIRPETYFEGYTGILKGGLCFTLLFLMRNNGFHTLILCLPFLFLCLRKYWKKLLILFLGLFLIYQFYNGPIFTLLKAEPGNEREAYSILMQTLGRTYVAGGDIRPEEMDLIRPVLDEETLSLYTPDLSDPIKNQFHTDAFQQQKAQFLKTWLTIGLRNKKIYIDAFLNTTAAFWYPDTTTEYLEFTCFDIEKENPLYPHVQMTPRIPLFHHYYTAIGTDAAFRKIPFLRELFSMGFYVWLMLYAALYSFYCRDYQKLLWMLPMWTYLTTSLLGPTALLRYAYPLILPAPLLLFYLTKPSKNINPN